jgi:hypothetical protein
MLPARHMTRACYGLAQLAESVGNSYVLLGEYSLAVNPPAVCIEEMPFLFANQIHTGVEMALPRM